jgi:predicted alpha-1,2-mannosidase
LVGTGAADLGNLRILPLAELADEPWHAWTVLDKETEEARPGYYACALPIEGVHAEMAASNFGARHRYSFEAGATLQIDPASSIIDQGVEEASIHWDGEGISGSVAFRGPFTGRARGFVLFFDIALSEAPTGVSIWNDDGVSEGVEATGERAGLQLEFPDAAVVELSVGVSLIDAERALANRLDEVGPETSLESVGQSATDAWLEVMDNVAIAGGTPRELRIFYSALYNAYRMPTVLSEPDGRYRGFDDEVHEASGHRYLSDLSMWDTYRTLHPWYSLTDPSAQRDTVLSLVAMSGQGGDGVPRWPAMLGETGSMIGESADIVIGDAAAHGIEGIDWDQAFEALYRNSYERIFDLPFGLGREGIEHYVSIGYLPYDRYGESVSKTLEYAWNDFGLAAVARAAGEDELAAELAERSLYFTNVIHPERAFPWPRDEEGNFDPDGSERDVYMRDGPFTEGSAWHWRFYGLHAPDVLAEAVGGRDALLAALETFFSRSGLGVAGRPNTALPDPFYWHGNEPAIHAAALFSALGEMDRATHWTREIQERLYDDTPAGLPGNDDGGTLSSWYLFASIGLYPVAGSDLYYLTAPLFEEAVVDLGAGETLTILAPGASSERRTIRSVLLDGVPLDRSSVRYPELLGATLEFTLIEEDK